MSRRLYTRPRTNSSTEIAGASFFGCVAFAGRGTAIPVARSERAWHHQAQVLPGSIERLLQYPPRLIGCVKVSGSRDDSNGKCRHLRIAEPRCYPIDPSGAVSSNWVAILDSTRWRSFRCAHDRFVQRQLSIGHRIGSMSRLRNPADSSAPNVESKIGIGGTKTTVASRARVSRTRYAFNRS